MKTNLKMKATEAIPNLRPFISARQLTSMNRLSRGEEGEFFLNKIVEMSDLITNMPKTYEQSALGDQAIVYLHYFLHGSDWYITEKDCDGGVDQAYGFAVLNGDTDMAECGFISIAELVECGVELDLHFTPCRLAEIIAKHKRRTDKSPLSIH